MKFLCPFCRCDLKDYAEFLEDNEFELGREYYEMMYPDFVRERRWSKLNSFFFRLPWIFSVAIGVAKFDEINGSMLIERAAPPEIVLVVRYLANFD